MRTELGRRAKKRDIQYENGRARLDLITMELFCRVATKCDESEGTSRWMLSHGARVLVKTADPGDMSRHKVVRTSQLSQSPECMHASIEISTAEERSSLSTRSYTLINSHPQLHYRH